jgi:dTDP-glucose 4,6-dehydratase
MPLYGDGTNVRDWLFVKDLADGIVLALEKGRTPEAYNFSALDEHTNLDVVRRVCQHLDRLYPLAAPHARHIKFVADRPGHDVRYALSSAKARQELGWQRKTNFEAGLAATVDWYSRNPDWTERILLAGYSLRRLGLPTAI